MCQTCDANTTTSTNVSFCSCNRLEYVAAHYDTPTNKTKNSELTMIYPDYYALAYWRESFGFYLILWAGITYGVGLALIIFCDQFPRRRMLIKIYDTIKRREVFEGYTEEDDTISSEETNSDIDDNSGSGIMCK